MSEQLAIVAGLMTRLGSFLSKVLAGLIVVGGFGLLVWAFIEGVQADPAVVGSIATALIGFLGLVYQRSKERAQELEKIHRDEMAPMYEELIRTLMTIEQFTQKPQEDQIAFLRQIAAKLMLHGPSPVVRAWIAWLRALAFPLSVSMPAQERLLLAIRADLGINNNALKRGDLVRLYFLEEDSDESRDIWRVLRSGRTQGPKPDL